MLRPDFWHSEGVPRVGIPSVMLTDGPHGIRKRAEKRPFGAEGCARNLLSHGLGHRLLVGSGDDLSDGAGVGG